MEYLESFSINLPPFIERSYDVSPGVVSAVFKVIWSIFSFIVVATLVHFGLSALWIEKSETGSRQKSLWQLHNEYSQVQGVSNGRWGSMVSNLSSKRVIIGFLFWAVIYSFELLFSLSIDNAYVARYDGIHCVGRVDNFTQFNGTMWDLDSTGNSGNFPSKNITLLRQLLNSRQVGNIAMLGNGIFAISPTSSLYTKGQEINVARSGFNCSSTIRLDAGGSNTLFYQIASGERVEYVSTPNFPNISLNKMDYLRPGYVNIYAYEYNHVSTELVSYGILDGVFLLLVGYPRNKSMLFGEDPQNIYLSQCNLFYEYGVVTVAEDGYLNETNIGKSYIASGDGTAQALFDDSAIYNHLIDNANFLHNLDIPDVFLTSDYNKSYSETMELANDIISAHLLNGLNQLDDPCSFNQEKVPLYFYVIGTKMSFGYIMIGILFALVTLLVLLALSFIIFTSEERKRWNLYSNDYCFEGVIATGNTMDKKEFKLYAANTYPRNNRSSRASEDDEETELDPKSLKQ